MANYYNEIDPFAAAWLRALIAKGLIPEGEVDERSIKDVQPEDLRQFTQCHFFAGIAGWSYALHLAEWPVDRPIWTGSCPCQPFSVAGKGKGAADERHLWPEFHRLIRTARPPVVMGEQVAGKAGYDWFDGVSSDLEREGYAAMAVDIPACAIDAPHFRQRLYWVAKSMDAAASARCGAAECEPMGVSWDDAWRQGFERRSGNGVGMADAMRSEWRSAAKGRRDDHDGADPGRQEASGGHQFHSASDMADADDARREGRIIHAECAGERSAWSEGVERRRGADGKARRVKSGLCLLANGVPNRVGRLRGFGNAIVPPLAAEVIKAFMDAGP